MLSVKFMLVLLVVLERVGMLQTVCGSYRKIVYEIF